MTETVQVALITAISTLASGTIAAVLALASARSSARQDRIEARRTEARRVMVALAVNARAFAAGVRSAGHRVATRPSADSAAKAWMDFANMAGGTTTGPSTSDAATKTGAALTEARMLIGDAKVQRALQLLRSRVSINLTQVVLDHRYENDRPALEAATDELAGQILTAVAGIEVAMQDVVSIEFPRPRRIFKRR